MPHLKSLLILLAVCMLLVACSRSHSQRCVSLPGGVEYCLQSSTQVAPFTQQQSVTVYFKQVQETMLTSVEVDSAGVRMVLLSPLGQTLASVNMPNEGEPQIEQQGKNWDAKWLLALLQVTRWPAAQVQAGLGKKGELYESAMQRDIMLNGRPIMHVNFHEAEDPYRKFTVRFPMMEMRLDIESLE